LQVDGAISFRRIFSMTFAGMVPGVLGAIIRDTSPLPYHIAGAVRVDPWTAAAAGSLLFSVPGIARYLVSGGTTIDVEAEAGADRSSVELFLNGSARGTLIHQRGELPIEAATVLAPNGGAVAISSYSGFGKSTLAAELCCRGWSLIADDITRVTWTSGRVLVWPSHDALKLWRDACVKLGMDVEALPRVREGMEKFHVRMPAASAPAVLRTVIRLRAGPHQGMTYVPPSQHASLLSECTFRRHQVAALRQQESFETMLRQVAGACRIMVLSGARELPTAVLADRVVEAVL
jgi:hypothetical protein